jgi:hypothetical protein
VQDAENATHGVRSYALDTDAALRLWRLYEDLAGERLPPACEWALPR